MAQSNEAAAGSGAQSDIMLKKALIERKLEETGEKARLEEFLRQRLIESGWRDDLKRHCLGKSFDSNTIELTFASLQRSSELKGSKESTWRTWSKNCFPEAVR